MADLFRWVPGSVKLKKFPSGALRVGSEGGEDIFAGRAQYMGDTLPAKIIPSKNAVYVCWGGKEILADEFEALVSPVFSWRPCKAGNIEPGAVDAGVTAQGEKLYYGRVTHDGHTTPGKIQPSHGCCYYPFNGVEIRSNEYEVLVLL